MPPLKIVVAHATSFLEPFGFRIVAVDMLPRSAKVKRSTAAQ
jgi:hypothetical protein